MHKIFDNFKYTPEQKEYYDSLYARGTSLHFITSVSNKHELDSNEVLACPGTTVCFRKEDQNDIDYCEKYRPKEYVPNPYLGKENPVDLNVKKLGLSRLEKCYILMDEPDKVDILKK